MQMTELHYSSRVTCNLAEVKSRAQEILERELDSSDPGDGDKAFLIIHKQFPIKYKQGSVPAQTAILSTDNAAEPERYTQEIQQSRRCRDAADLLKQSRETRLVTEMLANLLPRHDRVSLYHGVLRAMIEVTNPHALVFKHSQQIISPADYLQSCSKDPIFRPGSLNVRFFNIADSDGDMVMDTRGLAELGLYDLQCHFRGLDPSEVGCLLYNTAFYIFQEGPVIESGHTVAGTQPDSKWRCQIENSLVEPKREVLDLNPGKPFAAGKR